jgi:hypothetical protein
MLRSIDTQRSSAPVCGACRRKLSNRSIQAGHALCPRCQAEAQPNVVIDQPTNVGRASIKPLDEKTLDGIRRVAFHKLHDADAVEDVVQDVHHEYLIGRLRKDLLLRAARLRAIDKWRAKNAESRTVAAQFEDSDAFQVRDEDTGRVETIIVDMSTTPPPGIETDPAVEAIAGLMVRGGRIQVARGGRTIANPRRNEDRMLGRLIAKQERGRQRAAGWEALERLAEGAGRGRPNQKDRAAAVAVLDTFVPGMFSNPRVK